MEPIKGYKEAKAAGEPQPRLPVDGYVVVIKAAEIVKYDWGKQLLISFDIAEGEHKGYYAENYKAQTQEDKKWKGVYRLRIPDEDSEWFESQRAAFKRDIEAVEDSNKDYVWKWDEKTLKGKLVGALMQDTEYSFNGRSGFYTACGRFIEAARIRDKKFTLPKQRLLKKKKEEEDTRVNINELFGEELDGVELPF